MVSRHEVSECTFRVSAYPIRQLGDGDPLWGKAGGKGRYGLGLCYPPEHQSLWRCLYSTGEHLYRRFKPMASFSERPFLR